MFPIDATTTIVDNPNNNAVLLSATTTDRTILKTSINCQIKSVDTHIMNGTNYVYDWENTDISTIENFTQHVVPASTTVTYTETATQHCSVQLVYVNRNREKVPDPYPYATSTLPQYASSTTSSTTVVVQAGYNGASYMEWLAMCCVIIVPLYYLFFRALFRKPKPQRMI